jgi:hypothetical protein
MTFPEDNSKDCARAWEAMPWALQNNATQEQEDWLTQHLAQCESCCEAFAQESRLRLAISLPSDVPVNADAGLRRLLARIEAPDVYEASLRSRTGNWLTRALVAAVLVQAIGIGVLGAKLWSETGHATYHTLSQKPLAVPPGAIHVVPDNAMKFSDWNALLGSLGLRVVGGPNAVGAYTVVARDATAPPQNTLHKLRATNGIRLAEPATTTP